MEDTTARWRSVMVVLGQSGIEIRPVLGYLTCAPSLSLSPPEIIDDITQLVDKTDSRIRNETRRVKLVETKSASCGVVAPLVAPPVLVFVPEMLKWFRTGSGRVQDGFRTGAGRVQDGCRMGSGRVQNGFRTGAGRVQDGFRTGSGRVQDGCRTGAGWVQDGCRTGAGRVQDGLRTGSERVQNGCREDSGVGYTTARLSGGLVVVVVGIQCVCCCVMCVMRLVWCVCGMLVVIVLLLIAIIVVASWPT
ncbi:hypothetical protein NFI96_026630 [Prochilodus magdalenae]|nr:hypothetical protein NFI96_026630 [Prochilodus magdalenae]